MTLYKTSNKKIRSNEIIKIIFNLSIIGIGIGVLAGSLLKSYQYSGNKSNGTYTNSKSYPTEKNNIYRLIPSNEIKKISTQWTELSSLYKGLEASGYLLLENGKYAEINASRLMPANETITVFLLFISLNMIENGELKWEEKVQLRQEDIADGSGWIRYESIGKEFPIHEIVTEMIRVGDNTAANLLIRRIGGINLINKRLKALGMAKTRLITLMPDKENKNKTTAKELVKLVALINNKNHLGVNTRDIFRDVLRTSTLNKFIPSGILEGLGKNGTSDYELLIEGFRVFNKAGEAINSSADVAIIQMPDSSNALAAFLVHAPDNQLSSSELIKKMSASFISLIND